MNTLTESTGATGLSPASRAALRHLVTLFGLIWLINAGFQASAWLCQPDHAGSAALLHVFTKATKAAPGWLRPLLLGITSLIQGIGLHWIALGMVVIALLLGVSLISRIGLAAACWLGIAYCLVCWVALCALGYPYAGGQTDPGVFPAYVIAFVFVLSVLPTITGPASAPRTGVWTVGRLLFGLLWAFDAALKWVPYFLTHFLDQLTPAAQGQPAWIAAYIGLIIIVVKAVGPMLMAVVIALVETAIAISVLTGRWLIVSVPLGFLYALSVWTSAEGFGGPYSRAGTGVRGNVLGNVLIYAVIFLIMLVPLAQKWMQSNRVLTSRL
jgi:hypothetical protein